MQFPLKFEFKTAILLFREGGKADEPEGQQLMDPALSPSGINRRVLLSAGSHVIQNRQLLMPVWLPI